MPFPTALKSLFSTFSVLSILYVHPYFILYWISVIWRRREVSRPYHAKSFWEIWFRFFPRNHFIIRGFSPWNGERFLSLVQCGKPSWEGGGGIVWLVAWKLVSNDAKRTVAPPNAKHSTLLQGCFFYVFVFDSIHNSATLHNLTQGFSAEPKKFLTEFYRIFFGTIRNNMHIISFFLLKYKVCYGIFFIFAYRKKYIYNFII